MQARGADDLRAGGAAGANVGVRGGGEGARRGGEGLRRDKAHGGRGPVFEARALRGDGGGHPGRAAEDARQARPGGREGGGVGKEGRSRGRPFNKKKKHYYTITTHS